MRRIAGWVMIVLSVVIGAASASLALTSSGPTSGAPEVVERALRGESPSGAHPAGEAGAGLLAPDQTTLSTAEPAPASAGAAGSPAPAPEPVGLRIGAIAVDAPVDPYGVDAATLQMDVPDNVTDVAWYRFGASPGEPGSAVLAAHVDLAGQGPGVFFDLRKLDSGDTVTVVYADGSDRSFRVVARTVYEKDELPTDVLFAKDGPPVLTLITCGGSFSRSDSRYDSNVVVYAVPLDSDTPSRLE